MEAIEQCNALYMCTSYSVWKSAYILTKYFQFAEEWKEKFGQADKKKKKRTKKTPKRAYF